MARKMKTSSPQPIRCPKARCGNEELQYENGLFRCPRCGCTFRVECAGVEGPKGDCGQFSIVSLKAVEILSEINRVGGLAGFSELERVTLPEGLSQIAAGAFSGCSSLREIHIPASLNSIGDHAFSGCGLETITLPEKLVYIGKSAFYDCKELMSVSLMQTVRLQEGMDFRHYCRSRFKYRSSREIGKFAFANCTKLEKLQLSERMGRIGEGAFSGCSNLREIGMPKEVEYIDCRAFSGCGMEVMKIPYVRRIQEEAFSDCKNLKEVVLPKGGLECLDDRAFYGCTKLERVINLPDPCEDDYFSRGKDIFEGTPFKWVW